MQTKGAHKNTEIKNTVPNEMLNGFAGATLVLVAALVLSINLMEQTFRTGTAVILGLGIVGCGELNKLFCDNDVYSYGNIPGLKFTWTKTIGVGDECCDFKMELIKRRR